MKIFLNRKKRREWKQSEILRIEKHKKEKDFSNKLAIKRILNSMKVQSKKLDVIITDYIKKARKAVIEGNESKKRITKAALKICVSRQRFMESLILDLELGLELNSTNEMIKQFMEGINIISSQMTVITSHEKLLQSQEKFDKALSKNIDQYETLESFVSMTNESIEGISVSSDNLSEDEIDKMILGSSPSTNNNFDEELNDNMSKIRERIKNI